MSVEHGGGFVPEEEVPGDHQARYEWAAQWLEGRRVLDAGCGYGYGADFLATHGARRVVGVDSDGEAIRYARQRFRNDHLAFVRAEVKSVRTGAFDAVVSFEVLEHVRDGAAYIAELARTLRPEGFLLLSTPNRHFTERFYVEGRSPNPFHLREYYPEEVAQLLASYFPAVKTFHETNPEAFWAYSEQCWVPRRMRQLVPKMVRNAWLRLRGVHGSGTPGRFRFEPVEDIHRFPRAWGAQLHLCRK